jgi:hypothetical protein
MIIKTATDNQPILSNVGQVGEFRIRNSAKAFSILSSGLYANKIRAIIREYSCNAVDSHVEAGRTETPFDVHLPNALEPWFAVRDYGVGLDEQQVRNIFTTYFESTKTATDELIGGLGLGSKSAFSFTDNFTIVAVKNGTKRVFTAFINEQGVPSIAPMGEEASNEPTGVEIRFAVENSYDFRKFYEEARVVYKHFKLRPVVSGGLGAFSFIDPEYDDRDIVPGVHSALGNRYSVAVMGNIEYPLQIPGNADLGGLEHLLTCGLVLEFGIGELDIQASREGLSYIPETVAAIKTKLEALNAVLTDKLTVELDAIKNSWEKAFAISNKLNSELWGAAAKKYVTDTGFDLITAHRYGNLKNFQLEELALAKNFNIKISAFRVSSGYNNITAHTVNTQTVYNNNTGLSEKHWRISVSDTTQFVENDTSVGAGNRAKYHWKNTPDTKHSSDAVYVLEKADKKLDMKLTAFYKSISNPPASQKRKASTLMQQERAVGMAKGVTVLKLEKRDNNYHMRSDDMVWRDAGDITSFDAAKTYYYLPMSGFQSQGAAKAYDMKTFAKALKDSGIFTETVFGVRKADLAKIQGQSNWVNLDEHILDMLAKQGAVDVKGVIKQAIGFASYFKFTYVQNDIIDLNSPYLKLYNEFANAKAVDVNARKAFEMLCVIYNVTAGKVNVTDEIAKYTSEMKKLEERYPLLSHIDRYFTDNTAISEYINAIDMIKK